jgi:hypothetical protein
MEQWQKEGFKSMRAWTSAYNQKQYAARKVAKAAKKEVEATAASESVLAALAAVASPMVPIMGDDDCVYMSLPLYYVPPVCA